MVQNKKNSFKIIHFLFLLTNIERMFFVFNILNVTCKNYCNNNLQLFYLLSKWNILAYYK